MALAVTMRAEWLKSVLFDRGYLARIKGEAIKVYLVMVQAADGRPDRSVRLSLADLVERTRLSAPTVAASLRRLEQLGLVVGTTRARGHARGITFPIRPRRRGTKRKLGKT